MTAQAARVGNAAAAKARETVAGSDAGARLLAIVRIDDDRPMSPEWLLVMLVDAVNGEQRRELTDRDVLKAAKKRQRLAGAAGAAGGPVGLQLASLYCEAEIICDVAERHRLALAKEELAAHLLVLWNAMPDVDSARAAIDGSGLSVFARMAADAHAKLRHEAARGDDQARRRAHAVEAARRRRRRRAARLEQPARRAAARPPRQGLYEGGRAPARRRGRLTTHSRASSPASADRPSTMNPPSAATPSACGSALSPSTSKRRADDEARARQARRRERGREAARSGPAAAASRTIAGSALKLAAQQRGETAAPSDGNRISPPREDRRRRAAP